MRRCSRSRQRWRPIVDAQTLDVVDELPTIEPVSGPHARGARPRRPDAVRGRRRHASQVIPVDRQVALRSPRPCTMPGARPRRRSGTSRRTSSTSSGSRRGWRADGLRRGAPRQRGLRRRRAAVRSRCAPDGRPARPARPPTAARRSRSPPTARSRRSTSCGRRPRGASRHADGRARGRPHLPARAPPLRAPRPSGSSPPALVLVEGMLFANSRIAMNDVYVTTFILLAAVLFTPALHRHRPAPLEGGGAPAHRHRRRARARAGIEMGGALRHRRARAARAAALGARPLARARRVHRRSPRSSAPSRSGRAETDGPEPELDVPCAHAPAHRGPCGRHRAAAAAPVTVARPSSAAALPILAGDRRWPRVVSASRGRAAPRRARDPDAARHRGRHGACVGGLLVLGVGVVDAPPRRRPRRRERRRAHRVWLTPARGDGPAAGSSRWPSSAALPLALYVLSYAPWVDARQPVVRGLPGGPTGRRSPSSPRRCTTTTTTSERSTRRRRRGGRGPSTSSRCWFYQDSFAGPTTGLIHDTGNLVVFWLGIPAMAFAALGGVAAPQPQPRARRRPLALRSGCRGLASIARRSSTTSTRACRSSSIALAYLLAELWRGPGPRTWFLARVATALAVLGRPAPRGWRASHCAGLRAPRPPIRTGSRAAPSSARPRSRPRRSGRCSSSPPARRSSRGSSGARPRPPRGRHPSCSARSRVRASAAAAGAPGRRARDARRRRGRDDRSSSARRSITLAVSPEVLALLGLVVLSPVACARDARPRRPPLRPGHPRGRGRAGSSSGTRTSPGCRCRRGIAHVYQGVLPTWNWDFQFAVNLDPPATGPAHRHRRRSSSRSSRPRSRLGAAVAARSWGRRPRRSACSTAPIARPATPRPDRRDGSSARDA